MRFAGSVGAEDPPLMLGIVTVRITWDRLKETPEHEAARLLAILSTRRKAAA